RPRNCFRVVWDGTSIELQQFKPETREFQRVQDPVSHASSEANHAYQVALDNVDRTVRFTIDGHEVLSHQASWTATDALKEVQENAAAGTGNAPTRVATKVTGAETRISVAVDGPSTLAHLKLFRDLYYTQSDPSAPSPVMHTANAHNPLL